MKQRVYDFLGQSPIAAISERMTLGEGCAVSIWENTRDRVSYIAPADHTFSLYLKGGAGTRRVDAGNDRGFPGALCIMPEGCDSEWEISEPFRFLHLYISDARLRSGFVRTHDCDARRLIVEETTFAQNTHLAAPLSLLAKAALTDDTLCADTALAELFAALTPSPVSVNSGLSPHVLRRIDEWIDAHLDQTIALDDLAALANLSSFHFHRMFRTSRGLAPHAWVSECRISRARRLLTTNRPVAEISAQCGFSSQSHLTRMFRRHTGKTPAEYRSIVRKRNRPAARKS